ncbi:hypothetical protein A2442_01035 [Candidatus Campbellbacteria bacterium RIFOXYC2_FULL_35_25]|uniref:Uncharacterized protein n=1 Tax=Candidatus Campbellbacteria bacterium RIFOXYC2_FULL_35_25 TaxID=1797582 RepID=A0A1F5EJE1_9BACT|nr:MAG: hypothetical protein A2442_01035 [Candidatus Campbellbacteria bacterium RIFOXYC2_FULL_35_25]
MDKKIDVKIEKLKNSEVEITGAIPFEELEKHRAESMKRLGENISVDGFRKGHVPEKVIVEKVGEMSILNEMAEKALQASYLDILLINKIDAITSPEITITKLAPNNPLEFKIKVAVMPEIKLPDYKKIALKENSKKEEKIEVTEEEIAKTIEQVIKNQKHIKHEHAEGEVCEEDEEQENKETEKQKNTETEELTDEMVKKLGDFKDVEDFKVKLKENMLQEKTRQQSEKRRLGTLSAIQKESQIELPEILIEGELRKMLAEMSDNISRMGLQFDKYLEHIKKTEDDLKKEWRPDAENRVKGQLVLNEISKEEKILPNEEEAKKNIDVLMSQYENAKRENVEIYVKMMMSNEMVFKLLEEQK